MTLSVLVLVSEGVNPVSLKCRKASADASALELALRLSDIKLTVLHVGDPSSPCLDEYLGMGVNAISVMKLPRDVDAFSAIQSWIRDHEPDLILAGDRSERSEGSGFLPYALAKWLEAPIIPHASSLSVEGNDLKIVQSLQKGWRNVLRSKLPAIVTAAERGPAPRQHVFANVRSGKIDVIDKDIEHTGAKEQPWSATPAQPRVKNISVVNSDMSAEERLLAVTATSQQRSGQAITLAPLEAATLLLEHLYDRGMIEPVQSHLKEPK